MDIPRILSSLLIVLGTLTFPALGDIPFQEIKDKGKMAPVTATDDWIAKSLQAHNELRCKHGAPDLTLNKQLSEISQAWANHLAKGPPSAVDHNYEVLRPYRIGENIAFFGPASPGEQPEPANSPKAWYDEIKDYNFDNCQPKTPGALTGHFTQLVWKESTEFGIGWAEGAEGYYIVANYYPAGNVNIGSSLCLENVEKEKGCTGKGKAGSVHGNGEDKHDGSSPVLPNIWNLIILVILPPCLNLMKINMS